jgi:hypothetical protein
MVAPECLLAKGLKGAEVCVVELIDQVQAAQGHGAAAVTQPAAIAAAVVVPLVVVGERLSWPGCSGVFDAAALAEHGLLQMCRFCIHPAHDKAANSAGVPRRQHGA